MTEHLVSISYAAWEALSGPDQHAIFHTTSKSDGSLRIEAVSDDDLRMPPMVVFRGECADLVPVPEVHEAIWLAEEIINNIGSRGRRARHLRFVALDRLDFYFTNADAAVLFKLTWGGAA